MTHALCQSAQRADRKYTVRDHRVFPEATDRPPALGRHVTQPKAVWRFRIRFTSTPPESQTLNVQIVSQMAASRPRLVGTFAALLRLEMHKFPHRHEHQ